MNMTTEQYLAELKRLGLTPASKQTAAALGVGVRQIMRYAAGHPIPRYVEIILHLYTALSRRERNRALARARQKQSPQPCPQLEVQPSISQPPQQ